MYLVYQPNGIIGVGRAHNMCLFRYATVRIAVAVAVINVHYSQCVLRTCMTLAQRIINALADRPTGQLSA